MISELREEMRLCYEIEAFRHAQNSISKLNTVAISTVWTLLIFHSDGEDYL